MCAGQRFSLQVEKVLFHDRSDFQVCLSGDTSGCVICLRAYLMDVCVDLYGCVSLIQDVLLFQSVSYGKVRH